MKTILKTKGYIIREATGEFDNDGYKYAVVTKDEIEGNGGSLKGVYPEWQCDSFTEALDFVQSAHQRELVITCIPSYKQALIDWQKGLFR